MRLLIFGGPVGTAQHLLLLSEPSTWRVVITCRPNHRGDKECADRLCPEPLGARRSCVGAF